MKIQGHYPKEIEQFLQEQIREAAKPQPNLEIDNFLIKTFRRVDKLTEEFQAKSDARIEEYKTRMAELEALRQETEERRIQAEIEYNREHQDKNTKPILNRDKVKIMGVWGAAMDMFFSKKKP